MRQTSPPLALTPSHPLARVRFVALGPGLGAEEIADGERRIVLPIPAAYKALLMHTNGARLERAVYFAPPSERAGEMLVVQTLAGIRPSGTGVDPDDLASWHECFGKSNVGAPAGAFQFASAPDGDFVVYAEGRLRGEVHYIDRETKKRRRLTSSIEAFLDGLRARDDAEVVAAFPIAPTRYVCALRPPQKKVAKATKRAKPRRIVEDATFDPASAPSGPGFSTYERIELVRPTCTLRYLSRAIFRDVVVRSATIRIGNKVLSLENCLFDRVKVEGDIGGGVFVRTDPFGLPAAQKQRLQTFYDDVEWALDLRGARFRNLTLRGVPGHLVLRDPERQVLIRSDRLAEDARWRKWDAGFVAILEHALECPDDWHFHSADELSPRFEVQLARLKKLRKAGFGE